MLSFETISDKDLLFFAQTYLLQRHVEYFNKIEEAEKAGRADEADKYEKMFWNVQAQLDEVWAAMDKMKEQEVGA